MYVLVVGFRHMRASMSSKRRRSRLCLQATSSQIVRRLTAGEHLSLQGLRRLATPETIREDFFSCREKLEAPALRPCSEEERTNAFPCAALPLVGVQVCLTAANRVSSRQSPSLRSPGVLPSTFTPRNSYYDIPDLVYNMPSPEQREIIAARTDSVSMGTSSATSFRSMIYVHQRSSDIVEALLFPCFPAGGLSIMIFARMLELYRM